MHISPCDLRSNTLVQWSGTDHYLLHRRSGPDRVGQPIQQGETDNFKAALQNRMKPAVDGSSNIPILLDYQRGRGKLRTGE